MRANNQSQALLNRQLRRQAHESPAEQRDAIVKQAQALDSQGQPAQFFYNSTIQAPTAVTKALKAHFTVKSEVTSEGPPPLSEHEEMKSSPERTVWKRETNLVTFSSNVLKVYALPSDTDDASGCVELRLSTQFNARILDVICVPTEPFLLGEFTEQPDITKKKSAQQSAREARNNRRRNRDLEQQMIDTSGPAQAEEVKDEPCATPDYLFVLLTDFKVALLCYSRKDHRIEVVSRGDISEKILSDRKEPPYPVFLGQTGNFIALMLYHNILKVIPLVRGTGSELNLVTLTHATSVRVRHSNVMQVIPLFEEGNPLQPTFGVVYQRTEHVRVPGSQGPPALSVKVCIEKQVYDIERRDLSMHAQNCGRFECSSNSVYRVEPLTFGGFLVFDLDTVSYYRKEYKVQGGAYQEQLKSAHAVSAFCQVDEYREGKALTESGSPFVRYLFATEAGELFMLAMHAETLNDVLGGQGLDPSDSLINVEFLASKLTFCSSLVYLDDSLVFYSSREGDSFILRICAEPQGSREQPYVKIEQRFTSLAPIMDLQLARPENMQGQQSELVVVGGWNHQTNLNLVKQGVGLTSVHSFEPHLPANLVQDFYTCADRAFFRIYGYDQLIGIKVASSESGSELAVEGFDVSRNFAIRTPEQVLLLDCQTLCFKEATQQEQQPKAEGEGEAADGMEVDQSEQQQHQETEKTMHVYFFATSSSIKVLSTQGDQIGDKVVAELLPQSESVKFTMVRKQGNTLLVASQGGLIRTYIATLDKGGQTVTLTQTGEVSLGAEVSAMCFSGSLAYVTLYDAPHYSLNVLSLPVESQDLRLLARMPLSSVLEMTHAKKFYQHQLVKGGHVFSQFNQEKKVSHMLQKLPSSAGNEGMEVDQKVEQKEVSTEIEIRFNCTAALSIERLSLEAQETDQVILGFANGKVLQVCVDLSQIKAIQAGSQEPFLDFQTYIESRLDVERSQSQSDQVGKGQEELNLTQRGGPFWGAQVSYVGTVHPKMRRVKTDQNHEAVMACCDRPAVFYEVDESIEMHYLAQKEIRQIACLQVSSTDASRPLLMYEDGSGVLHLSENDSLRRLQVQRMAFKMQISKTLLLPSNDSIVVLLEQPNMDYIDSTKQACNLVGLVSRTTMRTTALCRLQKAEIANCAATVFPKGRKAGKWLLIGTAFLNPEETIPSMGRLLLVDAQSLDLVQEFSVAGSVQSVLVSERNQCLLLGVNNAIQAYDLSVFMPTLRLNSDTVSKKGKLEMLCQKSFGTFLQSITRLAAPGVSENSQDLAESVIVGDMTGRGVATFELKECRQSKIKIVESASSHISLWVNSIVALSDSQFIVFDKEGNLFIFQKNLYPTCLEEKLQLVLKGSYHVGEEVQGAAFGSLRSSNAQVSDRQAQAIEAMSLTRQKKRSYVDQPQKETKIEQPEELATGQGEDQEVGQSIIVTRGSVAKQTQQSQEHAIEAELSNPSNFAQILKDADFARKFAAKALEELFVLQGQTCSSLVYGTSDGSIGSLFSIPPKAYLLLQLLQHEMDTHVNVDLCLQKRSEYRAVKATPATATELKSAKSMLNGIIDGDLVEVYLDLPKNKKVDFARGMLGQSLKGDEQFVELLTQVVSLMKKTH